MKMLMSIVMLLCGAAALGSYSRGALLASGAMLLLLWWRGDHKVRNAVLLSTVAVLLVAFMPDNWSQRMSTIETYDQDASALGRLSAWWTAFGIAKDYPFGAGFEIARPELVAKYSPYPERVHAAHSIYFLVLGNHGFVGLLLYVLLGVTSWRAASRIRAAAAAVPEARWCRNLAGMCQVSLAAFAVGGAFLSLSYFDLPYYVMALLVVTERWVQRQGWTKEPTMDTAPRGKMDRLLASIGVA
jgi:probable O-glycosylation ligase (exosortase A-associated)